MTFEDNLYAALAKQAKGFGDLSESTQGTTGLIPRSKVGDAIITAGKQFCNAPGERIVVEFKMDRGYKFKNAMDEVATARQNRNAQIGIMVFAKGYEPPEIGDFRVFGDSIFCTEDAERAAAGEDMVHMEAAYAIARGLLLAMKKTDDGISVERLKVQMECIASLAERLGQSARHGRIAFAWGREAGRVGAFRAVVVGHRVGREEGRHHGAEAVDAQVDLAMAETAL
jgi:hypothetical protein